MNDDVNCMMFQDHAGSFNLLDLLSLVLLVSYSDAILRNLSTCLVYLFKTGYHCMGNLLSVCYYIHHYPSYELVFWLWFVHVNIVSRFRNLDKHVSSHVLRNMNLLDGFPLARRKQSP